MGKFFGFFREWERNVIYGEWCSREREKYCGVLRKMKKSLMGKFKFYIVLSN